MMLSMRAAQACWCHSGGHLGKKTACKLNRWVLIIILAALHSLKCNSTQSLAARPMGLTMSLRTDCHLSMRAEAPLGTLLVLRFFAVGRTGAGALSAFESRCVTVCNPSGLLFQSGKIILKLDSSGSTHAVTGQVCKLRQQHQ